MNQFGRRRKHRRVDEDHSDICFKPCGVCKKSLEYVVLFEEEMEAIRLSDSLGFYQQKCADQMGISRTTFSRTIESARRKVADALLNAKAIIIHKKESYNESGISNEQ